MLLAKECIFIIFMMQKKWRLGRSLLALHSVEKWSSEKNKPKDWKTKTACQSNISCGTLGFFQHILSVYRWVFTEIGTQCHTWERKMDSQWVMQSSYWVPAYTYCNSNLPLLHFLKTTATNHARGQKLARHSFIAITNPKTWRQEGILIL